jgi:hypothetical protein
MVKRNPQRYRCVMAISHQDHPAVYIFILSISVVAVPFYGGMLYSYYFKKIPD